MKQVKKYLSAFNVKGNVGHIQLFFDDLHLTKETFSNLPPDVFNAYINMLENNVVFLDSNGWLKTNIEVPHES